jgi:Icc protein
LLLRAFLLSAVLLLAAPPAQESQPLHFVLLGDRTGETQPAIFERVWKEIALEKPAFVVSVGDTIQGLQDDTATREWSAVRASLLPFRNIPLFLAPGNHDVWSPGSERLFIENSGHPLHYSFDRGPAHFTILDNSRSDQFAPAELAFLEQDLEAHQRQPVKFIISHRPSWIFNALLRNPDFPLHQLAKKYGVQFVVAGHVHQLLHYTVEGIEYISLPSAGGHLRASEKYEDGWFFGYTTVDVAKDDSGLAMKLTLHPLDRPPTMLATRP